jgi:outer membrane protein assembly factor BamD (BamD/ComL family)
MGKEQTRQRKRFLFYFACGLLAVLILDGCSSISEHRRKVQAYNYLDNAKELMERGYTWQAINEQEKARELFPAKPPGDRILYEMGLLLIDPRNQNRDYNKSLEIFQQLIRVFPQSRYRYEAENWRFIISILIESLNRIEKDKCEITTLHNKLLNKDKIIHGLREQRKKMKQIDLELNKKRELTAPEED